MHTNGQQEDEESRVREDSIAFVAETQNIFLTQVFCLYKILHGQTKIMVSEMQVAPRIFSMALVVVF